MSILARMLIASVVMCLGLAGILGFSMMFLLPDPPLPRGTSAVLLAVCVAVSVATFLWIVRLNRAWKNDAIARFDGKPGEVVARWEIPLDDWRALAAVQRREDAEAAPFAGGCLGLLAGAITSFACWIPLGPTGALLCGTSTGAIVGLAGWAMMRKTTLHGFREALAAGRGRAAIRPDALLLGDSVVIPWGGLHGRLENMLCEEVEGLDFKVLKIAIRKTAGRNDFTRVVRVPLAAEACDRVHALANRLAGRPE